MVHHFDPFLWQISGEFGIRWYGLSYMMGFVCAFLLIRWFSSRDATSLEPQEVGDFITYAAIGILVGGRLGYVFFYSPDLLTDIRSTFPYWRVLAVNEGGMASHGGMIGLIVAGVVFGMRYRKDYLHLLDLAALTGPIGILFGRLANFINGELVGRICDAKFPLAVKFPQDILSWPSREFSRVEGLSTIVDKIGISKDQWLNWVSSYQSDSSARYKIQEASLKIIEQIQNGDLALREAIAPLLDPRHPSQLYAAASEGLLLFLFLFWYMRRPRKPGLAGAWFVTLYAIVRISDELFRMPDAHIGFQAFGLTRGQWLSVVMLMIGFGLLIAYSRRKVSLVSGWGHRD